MYIRAYDFSSDAVQLKVFAVETFGALHILITLAHSSATLSVAVQTGLLL